MILPKPAHRVKLPKPLRRGRSSRRSRTRLAPMGRLRRELDLLFSRYVKDRDGLAACITCGQPMTPQNCNAGHFISRRILSTRWDPKNCHSQCVADNHFRRGAQPEYALAICDRYGSDELRRLLARKRVSKRWTRPELERLICALRDGGGAEFELAYYAENLN